MSSSTDRWDVIVIGAGPGGSTTANLLAQRGLKVLSIEKEHFPRFHVGESLLPASGILQTLMGVAPSKETFVYKRGVEFMCEPTGRSAKFDFADALPGPPRHAYQVDRPKFDMLLRDRAAEVGAIFRHGVKVTGVSIEPEEVIVTTDAGTERARYVVDASGQSRFFGNKNKSIEPIGFFGKAASFTHYVDIDDVIWQEFAPQHDIRVIIVPEGWLWVIPLAGQRLSVGVVSRKQGLTQDTIRQYVADSPALQRWTKGAKTTDTHLIGNFSYRNTAAYGPRFACVGDAAGFIDPVFSSGVSLAVNNAALLVERLGPALESGSEADPMLAAPVSEQMSPAYETFASLVYRFYNTKFVDNILFNAPSDAKLKPHVISVLAGDVFGEPNVFQKTLLDSRIQVWGKTSREITGSQGGA